MNQAGELGASAGVGLALGGGILAASSASDADLAGAFVGGVVVAAGTSIAAISGAFGSAGSGLQLMSGDFGAAADLAVPAAISAPFSGALRQAVDWATGYTTQQFVNRHRSSPC